MSEIARKFSAVPAVRSEEPLLLGMIGPPGGGKSLSSLRLAAGIQSVRGGDIIVIDTEGGRSRKYNDQIPFKIVELENARSDVFLEAILAQLASKPAAIIVDSMSDEHVAYLEWHDEMVPKMGGNEWAAWAKPAAARKKLITGILKIKTPLIFTFRARDKTKQEGKKVINIGWQPVAPLEIVHTLDLTCILLADPSGGQTEPAGNVFRAVARGQSLGNPPLPAGEGVQPFGEINAERGLVCDRAAVVGDDRFDPFAVLLSIESRHVEPLSLLCVWRQNVVDAQLGTDAATASHLLDGVLRERSRVGQIGFPQLDETTERDEGVGDHFLDSLGFRLRLEVSERETRLRPY